MKMRNYMKKKESIELEALMEEDLTPREKLCKFSKYRKVFVALAFFAGLSVFALMFTHRSMSTISLGEEGAIQLSSMPVAATAVKKSTITIPSGTVKANPFLPYRDLGKTEAMSDVPAYTLVEPPEMVNENSDAARVMDTIVSGILYDKYSPSAILNIEGNDYLVKKGDVVNNYKVLYIAQDSVTVKLGENTYKAGIGEILTEGSLNHNDVSNLNNKFGGVK